MKYVYLCFMALCCSAGQAGAQWIAPEGKIINYRTLVWADFGGKPTKALLDEGVVAATQPAIYALPQGVERLDNGKLKIGFKVKCAFQTASWRREDMGDMPSDYVLNHECDHYDIALTFANKLQQDLTNKEYSEKGFEKEILNIYHPLLKKYHEVQSSYDSMAGHGVSKDNQYLWDLRIKKCLELTTDQYYSSPLSVAQQVLNPGQVVKRLPDEPARLFAVRCRPLKAEFTDEIAPKLTETKEWTGENSAVIAFYTQPFKIEKEFEPATEGTRLLAYAFMPMAEREYKRVLIDTFCIEGKAPKITGVFFANADSADKIKEMVITTSTDIKLNDRKGTVYTNKVYDNTGMKTFPSRLRKLIAVNALIEGGFEGTENGKPVKARLKTEGDIRAELKKQGFEVAPNIP
ncbi:MAG: hypothetical protein H7257_09445 [Taibaiella sp.]|nr:hypothetical protein [Taibaiella sp.]